MKTLEKIYFLFAVLFTVFHMSSCEGDPETPPASDPQIQIIDSNIFNWRSIPVPTEIFFDYYVIDTMNIYYIGDERVYYYNGNSSIIIHMDEDGAYAINGSNLHNVFYGGRRYSGLGVYPWLMKWDGVSSVEIALPRDSNYSVGKIYVKSPEDVWISCHSGRLYHFIQDTVISYQLDRTNTNVPAFFEYGNELFYYFYYGETNKTIHKIYKFNNNQWVEHSSNETIDVSLQYRTSPSFINDTLLRRRTDRIELFEGSNWQLLTGTRLFEPYSMAGPSTNNFLTSGFSSIFRYMYFYDGEKWLYQSALPLPDPHFFIFPVDIVFAGNTYFGFYYAASSVSHNYILVGNLKEK